MTLPKPRRLTRNQKIVQAFKDGMSIEAIAAEVSWRQFPTRGAIAIVEAIIRRQMRKGKR